MKNGLLAGEHQEMAVRARYGYDGLGCLFPLHRLFERFQWQIEKWPHGITIASQAIGKPLRWTKDFLEGLVEIGVLADTGRSYIWPERLNRRQTYQRNVRQRRSRPPRTPSQR